MNDSAGPSLSHLLETSLYVSDLDASRRFYERVLGLRTLGADDRMCSLAVPGQSILLLFRRGGSRQPSVVPGGVIPGHDGQGAAHLCFAAPISQLDAWSEHLARCGVPIESRVRQAFGGVSLYFRDPEGNSVEVATPGLWETF